MRNRRTFAESSLSYEAGKDFTITFAACCVCRCLAGFGMFAVNAQFNTLGRFSNWSTRCRILGSVTGARWETLCHHHSRSKFNAVPESPMRVHSIGMNPKTELKGICCTGLLMPTITANCFPLPDYLLLTTQAGRQTDRHRASRVFGVFLSPSNTHTRTLGTP